MVLLISQPNQRIVETFEEQILEASVENLSPLPCPAVPGMPEAINTTMEDAHSPGNGHELCQDILWITKKRKDLDQARHACVINKVFVFHFIHQGI
jgi:hypothetical protein